MTRPRSWASCPRSVPVARHCKEADQETRVSFALLASTRKSSNGAPRPGRGAEMRFAGIAARLRRLPLCNADNPADLRSARRPDPPAVSMIHDVVTCSVTLGTVPVATPASRMPARNRSASRWLRGDGSRTSRATSGRGGRAWSRKAAYVPWQLPIANAPAGQAMTMSAIPNIARYKLHLGPGWISRCRRDS